MRIIYLIIGFACWILGLFSHRITTEWGERKIVFPGWYTSLRKPKPKPIESNILVDPSKVGEIIHRWNTWDFMLMALKVAQDALKDIGTPQQGLAKTEGLEVVQQAIQKAEKK